MDTKEQGSSEPVETRYTPHRAARPMEVVRDEDGNLWLCDKGVVPEDGKKNNGCWRCGDLAFTASD